MTGPGIEEEVEEYGTRCKLCGDIIWDGSPFNDDKDRYEVCRRCAIERREKKKP